jgi:hypothetical protein
MILLWLPGLVARLGRKMIAGDSRIPRERREHAVAVFGAVGAYAASVAMPIHNPWFYAVCGVWTGYLALTALRRAQRWERAQQAQLGRLA